MTKESVTLEMNVPMLNIAYLLSAAMEGGINYWAVIGKCVKPPEMKLTLEKLARDGDSHIYPYIDYPLNEGGSVLIIDEETHKRYTLDLPAIKRGLQIMLEKYPEHFGDFIKENADAITGDVFIQCCVFGELVYG